jgi:hypothetical protein
LTVETIRDADAPTTSFQIITTSAEPTGPAGGAENAKSRVPSSFDLKGTLASSVALFSRK